MATTANKTPFRILVAGFGRVSHVQPRDLPNPAFEIIKRLPPQLAPPCTTKNRYNHSHPRADAIEIIPHPDPLPSSYHGLLQTMPALVREHSDKVDQILLIGVAVGQQYYSVEQSAARDGYHEVPDLDRRTLAKGEGVKIWGEKVGSGWVRVSIWRLWSRAGAKSFLLTFMLINTARTKRRTAAEKEQRQNRDSRSSQRSDIRMM
ncbi:hypothetical protein PG990_001830 [Apiospora arundinis]